MYSARKDDIATHKHSKHKYKMTENRVSRRMRRATYSPEIMFSLIFVKKPSSGLRPPHFLARFPFLLDDEDEDEEEADLDGDFAPPRPSQMRPSAVPAHRTPNSETARDVTKGGREEIPGARAGSGADGEASQ